MNTNTNTNDHRQSLGMFVRKYFTVSVWSSLGDPFGEVADEVKEELVLRNAEDLVHHLHKEAEALQKVQFQQKEGWLSNLA